jgi:lipoprotein-anchoring transpeptidase ErfK/SrfK
MVKAPDPAKQAALPEPVVVALVDLSEQRLSLYVADELAYLWPVSTGREGYATPTGEWRAQWLSADHHSSRYGWAPMPWSVFFYGGYAIHGTTEIADLGRPASHGCIRLHPDNARILFGLVEDNGLAATLIRVVE